MYRGITAAIHSSLEDFDKFGTIASRIVLRIKHLLLIFSKRQFLFVYFMRLFTLQIKAKEETLFPNIPRKNLRYSYTAKYRVAMLYP